MDRIEILGIEDFGFHGVFEDEGRDGQKFLVDVVLKLDLAKASMSDDLNDTIDYGAVSLLVKDAITGEPFSLLEKLAGVIAQKLLAKFSALEEVEITVHKPEAPLAVKFQDVAVTVIHLR